MSEEEQHDGLSRMESVLGQKASALRHRDGMLHMIASKRGSPGGRVVLEAGGTKRVVIMSAFGVGESLAKASGIPWSAPLGSARPRIRRT
ncbi:hypothetical protein OHQ89_02930 [Streptomyces canus]|uniref:hypothetical protein n=1 Tax=Streptomyces canus TaxID=58343 RepID=UPI0030E482BC